MKNSLETAGGHQHPVKRSSGPVARRFGVRWPSLRRLGVLFVTALCLARANAQVGDYGDAPDPGYPSRASNGGPVHEVVTKEWLGPTNSATTTEGDSVQVNADADDAGAYVVDYAAQLFFLARLSHDGTEPATVRYLNVLIDLNTNGVWEGTANEWPIQNYAFSFYDIFPAGFNSGWVMLAIQSTNQAANYLGKWTRVTLSTQSVPNGNGAWGILARGETEDLVLAAAPITKPTLRPNVPAKFVPVASVFRHGVLHAADVANNDDAHLVFRFPVDGRPPCQYSLRARRVSDNPAGNPYNGGIPAAALDLPALGAGWTAWSPWIGVNCPDPGDPPVRVAITGGFAPGVGDSDFRFQVRQRYDPDGEAVFVDSGDVNLDGRFTVGDLVWNVNTITVDGPVTTAVQAKNTANNPSSSPYPVLSHIETKHEQLNFAGNGGTFSGDIPWPNGFPGDKGNNFIVSASTFAAIPPGTWSVGFGSDDGGSLNLPGITFTSKVGQDANGQALAGPSEIMYYSPRGHAWTYGVLTTGPGMTTANITTSFYEYGGGDTFEVALRSGTGVPNTLLANNVAGWALFAPTGPAPGESVVYVAGRGDIGWQDASALNPLEIQNRVLSSPNDVTPGLTWAIWSTSGNPGNLAGVQAAIASRPSAIGPFKNSGGSSWWTGSSWFPGIAKYPFEIIDQPNGSGSFNGVDNENYIASATGEILIPESGTFRFKDGVDDFFFLGIDLNQDSLVNPATEAVINDNNWTDFLGSANGGSPIVSRTFTGIPPGGRWYKIQIYMSEGAFGDQNVLYWDYDLRDYDFDSIKLNDAPGFPSVQNQPETYPDNDMVPDTHLRGSGAPQCESADLVCNLGVGLTGEKRTYVFDLDCQTGFSDQLYFDNPNPAVYTTYFNLDGATITLNLINPANLTPGRIFNIFEVDEITGSPVWNLPSGQSWSLNVNNGNLTYVGPTPTAPPTITQQPVSMIVTQGGVATFNVGVTGAPPFSFQWYLDGVAIPGATNSSYTIPDVQIAHAGIYKVEINNVAGSVISDPVRLSSPLTRRADVNLVADVQAPVSVSLGSNIVVTITITNTGLSNAASVEVVTTQPPGTTLMNMNNPHGERATHGTDITMQFGMLTPGQSKSATVGLRGDQSGVRHVFVRAHLPGEVDRDLTDNVADGEFFVSAEPNSVDLSILSLETSTVSPIAGVPYTYSITIQNLSSFPATNVYFEIDALTPAIIFTGGTSSAGPLAISPSVVRGALGTIESFQAVSNTLNAVGNFPCQPAEIVARLQSSSPEWLIDNNLAYSSVDIRPWRLDVQRSGLDIQLSWPAAGSNNAMLEVNTNIGNLALWMPSTSGGFSNNGAIITYTIPATNPATFYRLRFAESLPTNSVSFHQLDLTQDGVRHPFSEWGQADVAYGGYQSNSVLYLNISRGSNWVIQNVPLPTPSDNAWVTNSVSFPLAEYGSMVTNGNFGWSLRTNTTTSPPAINESNTVVRPRPKDLNSGIIGNQVVYHPPQDMYSTLVRTVGVARAWQSFPSFEQGTNECAPGAILNSLTYLNNQHHLNIASNFLTMDAMKDATSWTRFGCFGSILFIDGWSEDKDEYMQANSLPIETIRSTTSFTDAITALQQTNDVEIEMEGHAAVVVGIVALTNGNYQLVLLDDGRQGKEGGLGVYVVLYDAHTGYLIGSNWSAFPKFLNFIIERPKRP